jgi:uncharacterized protein YbcV (DUF1398 family)
MAHYLNASVILECTRLAFLDQMTFPQSLAELNKIGVERYVADLVRMEKTHYSACGDSLTDPQPLADAPEIAEPFSADAVVAALRAIQQKKIDYPQFLRQIMSAGCVLYWSSSPAERRSISAGQANFMWRTSRQSRAISPRPPTPLPKANRS